MPKLHAMKAVGTLCDHKGRTANRHDSFSYTHVATQWSEVTCSFCIERMLAGGMEISAEQAEMLPRHPIRASELTSEFMDELVEEFDE